MNVNHKQIHPTYEAAADAVVLLPDALAALERLKTCFTSAGEDFMAVDIKIMIARLQEIEDILINGDKG